jgi:hypothetical protein
VKWSIPILCSESESKKSFPRSGVERRGAIRPRGNVEKAKPIVPLAIFTVNPDLFAPNSRTSNLVGEAHPTATAHPTALPAL